jgi:pimeloyl-ACP methyl ester carboxylesterase
MAMRRPFLLLAACVLLLVCAAGRPAAAEPKAAPGRLALSACKVAGIDREVTCGRLEVFEDRERRKGRKISLRIVVLPATGTGRASDPIFGFAGGPGESAVESAAGAASEEAEANKKRDIVLVDTRGTGDSNGLRCKELQGRAGVLGYLESFLPVEGVRACRQALEPRADLALYTTAAAVDDVDDVRAALGYDRINLEGGSYGSFAALVYMRRHPEHVRAAVLQGIVPPGTRAPLYFAHDAQRALDQLFAACGADAGCRAAFPDAAGEVQRLLDRLDKKPAEVTIRSPQTGEPVKIVLGRSAGAQTIRYMLYLPITASRIPLEVHLAVNGDFGPLAQSAYLFGNLVTSTSDGLYLSVTCAEGVPRFTPQEAQEAARGTFLGDFRARAQKAACAEWPRGRVPPQFDEPVRSDAPTLLISGERDPVTPAYWGEQAARTLTHARHVVVPGAGHDNEGEKGAECIGRLSLEVIERGSVEGLDTSCVSRIEPVPFALRDVRAAEITLPVAELDRLAGTYAGADREEFVVRRQGESLQLALGEGQVFRLAAIAPNRFRVEGAPAGYFVEFRTEGGGVTSMEVEEGPTERLTLKKKP